MTLTNTGRSSAQADSPVGSLECRNLSAGYGHLTVVRDVTLSAAPGEVVALLGPNGAGKSTLLNCIAGFVDLQGGELLVGGSPLPSARPAMAARHGVALVPDDRALFTKLTVKENLDVARRRGTPPAESVLELFPALERRWTVRAGDLSGGEQQMLAVARSLLRDPKVLLIDELSMGLAPLVVEGLMPIVRRVADEIGAVVVLVEQHVRLALEVADRAVVLVHGRVQLEGSASELASDIGRLEVAYLGAGSEHVAESDPHGISDPVVSNGSEPPPVAESEVLAESEVSNEKES